jgi:hypothetical protein
MINLNQFVAAIHDAILRASDSLSDKNLSLLDRYFEELDSGKDGKKRLVPKSVVLEFHTISPQGASVASQVQVPLLTLVPITLSRIEKATLTAEFDIELVDSELQLEFRSLKRSRTGLGAIFGSRNDKPSAKLEIVISPNDTPEGLKLVVEAYELSLKRQIS